MPDINAPAGAWFFSPDSGWTHDPNPTEVRHAPHSGCSNQWPDPTPGTPGYYGEPLSIDETLAAARAAVTDYDAAPNMFDEADAAKRLVSAFRSLDISMLSGVAPTEWLTMLVPGRYPAASETPERHKTPERPLTDHDIEAFEGDEERRLPVAKTVDDLPASVTVVPLPVYCWVHSTGMYVMETQGEWRLVRALSEAPGMKRIAKPAPEIVRP